MGTRYDLVANVVHDGKSTEDGSFRAHVQHAGTKQWYETEDLRVAEIMPQQIGISESYMLVYRRSASAAPGAEASGGAGAE
jgi:U4/U6.U5 tri-snRNP-associated protein 2